MNSNDIFACTLVAFGLAGFFVATLWKETGGQILCALVVGYGLGIYSDRIKDKKAGN